MKTDVKETDSGYELKWICPIYKKMRLRFRKWLLIHSAIIQS